MGNVNIKSKKEYIRRKIVDYYFIPLLKQGKPFFTATNKTNLENKKFPGSKCWVTIDNDISPYPSLKPLCIAFNQQDYISCSLLPISKDLDISVFGNPNIGGKTTETGSAFNTIKKFYGMDQVIEMDSCARINEVVIPELCKFNYYGNCRTIIISDMLSHNSIIKGCHSAKEFGAELIVCPHNDIKTLGNIIKNKMKPNGWWHDLMYGPKEPHFIFVADGVSSFNGTIWNIPKVIELIKKYKCNDYIIYCDDAHALGTIGKTGKGTHEYWNLDLSEINYSVSISGGKSLHSGGGYFITNADISHCPYANGSLYTTGSSEQHHAVLQTSLLSITEENITHLNYLQEYFSSLLKTLPNVTVVSAGGLITLHLDSIQKITFVTNELYDRGIITIPATYPVVKPDEFIIRILITTKHTKDVLDYAFGIFEEVFALLYNGADYSDYVKIADVEQIKRDNFHLTYGEYCLYFIKKLCFLFNKKKYS